MVARYEYQAWLGGRHRHRHRIVHRNGGSRGPAEVGVFFNNSPVMRLDPGAVAAGVKPVAWFDSDSPLRRGGAWGQNRLEGGLAMAEAKVEKREGRPIS